MDKNHQKTNPLKENMNLMSDGESGSGSGRGTLCSVATLEYPFPHFKEIVIKKSSCGLRPIHFMDEGHYRETQLSL